MMPSPNMKGGKKITTLNLTRGTTNIVFDCFNIPV